MKIESAEGTSSHALPVAENNGFFVSVFFNYLPANKVPAYRKIGIALRSKKTASLAVMHVPFKRMAITLPGLCR